MSDYFPEKGNVASSCAEILPVFGHQPTGGARYPRFMPKLGKPRIDPELFHPEPEDPVAVVAANLKACFALAKRDHRLSDRTNAFALSRHLAAHPEHYGNTVSKSHLSRMVNGEGAVGSDVLHLVAKAYGLQAWHLLVPNMEPANPPVVLVSEGARKLYQGLEESMRAWKKEEAHNEQKADAGNVDEDRHNSSSAKGSGNNAGRRTTSKAAKARGPKAKA